MRASEDWERWPASAERYVEGGSDLMANHFLEVTGSMRQVARD